MVHELQFKITRMGWEYTTVAQELGHVFGAQNSKWMSSLKGEENGKRPSRQASSSVVQRHGMTKK